MMRTPLVRLKRLAPASRPSLLVIFLLLITIFVPVNNTLGRRQETQSQAPDVSPLIWGVNIDHQISTSTRAQALAKQLGVQTIRVGDTSGGAPPPAFYSKVQILNDMVLVPLIILASGCIASPAQR